MNTPTQGTRLTAANGTVFLIEAVHDLTTDPDFEPGFDRFTVELVEAAQVGDMGGMGYDLLESEFADWCTKQGITQPA